MQSNEIIKIRTDSKQIYMYLNNIFKDSSEYDALASEMLVENKAEVIMS